MSHFKGISFGAASAFVVVGVALGAAWTVTNHTEPASQPTTQSVGMLFNDDLTIKGSVPIQQVQGPLSQLIQSMKYQPFNDDLTVRSKVPAGHVTGTDVVGQLIQVMTG